MSQTINAVYYVESKVLDPIAIRPKYSDDTIEWENTGRGKFIHFSHLSLDDSKSNSENNIPRVISITKNDGENLKLLYLTKKIFDTCMENDELAGPLDLKTDSEVQKYYLKTNFYSDGSS